MRKTSIRATTLLVLLAGAVSLSAGQTSKAFPAPERGFTSSEPGAT